MSVSYNFGAAFSVWQSKKWLFSALNHLYSIFNMSIALGMVHVHKQSHELRGTVVNALFGPLWFCVEPSLHCSSTIHLIPRRILITTIADLIKIKAAWSVIFIMRVTYPDRYTGEHERRDKLPYSQPPRQLDIQLLTVAQDLTQLREKTAQQWLINMQPGNYNYSNCGTSISSPSSSITVCH